MPGPDIESRIREFVATNFGFRGASAGMDGNLDLLEQGILDSTGVLEVVGFLESDSQRHGRRRGDDPGEPVDAEQDGRLRSTKAAREQLTLQYQ